MAEWGMEAKVTVPVYRPMTSTITTAVRSRERKGWDLNATRRNAAAEPGGTTVLYR